MQPKGQKRQQKLRLRRGQLRNRLWWKRQPPKKQARRPLSQLRQLKRDGRLMIPPWQSPKRRVGDGGGELVEALFCYLVVVRPLVLLTL